MKVKNKKSQKVEKMSISEPVPNGHRGITLIALVITIIVLLILAAVSIATLTGENGILKQAEQAKESTVIGAEKEGVEMAYSSTRMQSYTEEELEEKVLEIFQGELDNIFGDGKATAVLDESFGELKVEFSDTGNIYYIISDYDSGSIEVTTGEEFMEKVNEEQGIETTDKLTEEELAKVESGFKIDLNSNNGIVEIVVDENAIIDWGDGTYSKAKDGAYGDITKLASVNDKNISVAGEDRRCIMMHKYNNANKIYNVKIYASEISVNSPALERITDWGANELTRFGFYDCSNLKEIVAPGENSTWVENVNYMEGCFAGCTSLKEIPSNFFDRFTNLTVVSYMFAGCTGLTENAVDLWSKGTITGTGCYEGCTNLANYESIPEEWK